METITLRDVTPADLPVFFDHQADPVACRMAGFPSRDWEAFMAHWAKILADDNNITRTILMDGQVVGNIASFIQEGQREVGYWIGRDFWGQGVASRALSALLILVRDRPLYGYVVRHNLASLRVLQKNGFAIVDETDEEVILRLDER